MTKVNTKFTQALETQKELTKRKEMYKLAIQHYRNARYLSKTCFRTFGDIKRMANDITFLPDWRLTNKKQYFNNVLTFKAN